MAESAQKVIQFSENEFNLFQKKIKTEWVESGFIKEYLDDSDDSDNTETYNYEEMTNTYTSEQISSTATTLNKRENINDTTFNTKEINISGSNSQELENSNLIVSSSHIKKMNTNQSDGDFMSNGGILLTSSQLPLSSQILKMNHKCSELCALCKKCFAILDNPNHIGRLRNMETQNSFLKIESSLNKLSCICDRCWNFLKKTHNLQKATEKTERHIPHVPNNVTKVNVDNLDSVNGGFRIENAANVNEVDKELRTENLDRDDERAEVDNTAIDGIIKVVNTTGVDEGSEVDNQIEVNEEFALYNTVNKPVNHIKHNRYSKKRKIKKRKQQPAVTCSVHNCFKYSVHPISSDEYIRINKIISQFDFYNIILIESKRKKSLLLGMPPLSVCEKHLDMINVLTTCQLCGNKLNGYLDSKEWKMHDEWNEMLKFNNIPLILKPGMFICTSCQNCVSKCNTLSPNILEDFRQNVKKRNDACRRSFGCTPQVNILKIYQESNVDPLNDAFNKFDSPTKIKFSDPLTTATYYFKPYHSELCSKKSEGKHKSHLHKALDMKSTKNTNLNCDIKGDPRKLKITSSDEEINSPDSRLSDVHKKDSKISVPSYYFGKMPTERTNKIMSLLRIPPYAQSDDTFLKNKNSLAKPTGGTENQILNDNSNNSSENKSTPIQNVTAEMDGNKDLLPLHVSSLLDNNESEMSIHFEADKNQSIPISANSHPIVHINQFRETKDVEIEKTHKCSPVNTNIHLSQNVINIKNKESNQNTSEMTDEYSYHYVYHEDESSSDLIEENLNNITENVVIVEPNEFDKRVCSLNSKNLHRMKPINHSELRKKLRNVVHQRISNRGIKKQKLNNTYELNENESYVYETNNSTEENSIDLIDDKNNVFRHLKVPTITTLFPRINENIDSNKSDIIDLSSDEDEGIPIDTNSMDETSSTDDLSSIHIERIYSLDPNFSKPLQIKRTLQKVDDFYASAMRSSSDNVKPAEDSQEYEIVYHDDSLNNQSNLNATHSFSMSEIDSQNTEFAQRHITINEEIEDLTQSDGDQSDSDNDEDVVYVQLDDSNRHIYQNLSGRYNNNFSDMVMHLMGNYQKLYDNELVLSENASAHASNTINYHLNHMHQIYGDPRMNNTTSVSFLPDSSESINDSTLNNITTTSSATHTPIMVSKLNNSSTNSEITIISEDEESDT